MTIQRKCEQRTDAEIKFAARNKGYAFKGYITCAACLEEATPTLVMTNKPLKWVKTDCALTFKKKGHRTVHVCGCGWLVKVDGKQGNYPLKRYCATRGCNSTLKKADGDNTICVNCINKIAGDGDPTTYAEGCSLKPKSGCWHWLHEGDDACIRRKCTHFRACSLATSVSSPSTPTANVGYPPNVVTCKTKNCVNPVPKGRTTYCTTCKPTTRKKPATPEVIQ